MTPAALTWCALGATAAVLAVTIAAEALPSTHGGGVALRPVSATLPVAARAAAPAPDRAAQVATILARPLFALDRRPEAEASAHIASGLPRLTGIVQMPGDAFGIFQEDAKAKPIAVADGGFLSGCAVGPIVRDRLTLTCNGVAHILEPSYLQGAARMVTIVPVTRLLHAKRTDPALQP